MSRLQRAAAAFVLVLSALAVSADDAPVFGAYTYDGSGNITAVGETDSFLYDKLGRLQRAILRESAGQTFTYDRWGNILTIETDGDSVIKKPGVNEATNRIDQVRDKNGNLNTEVGSYDGRGNLVSYGSGTFVYDGLDRVKEATVSAAGATRRFFVYTASGERIAAIAVTNAGTRTDWTLRDPRGRVLRRFTDTNGTFAWTEDYIYRGDHLLAAVVPDREKVRHFHLDHLGTPRLITGNGGAEIAQHHYYPFGPELPSSINDSEQAKFTGHERDASTLDYMHARYYDPTIGRFLSVDPGAYDLQRPQSWNRYSYVVNNPVTLTDPTGRCVWDICVGEAVAAGVVLTTATAYMLAPSSVPGKSNGDVMVDSAIDGFQAVGRWLFNGQGGGSDEMAAQTYVQNWANSAQKEQKQGTAGGDRAGKRFTPKGKKEIHDRNAQQNGGDNRCEKCDEKVVPGQKSQKGVNPPRNERQADHIIPKSKGGDGSPSNGQTLCRKCNRDKSDKEQ